MASNFRHSLLQLVYGMGTNSCGYSGYTIPCSDIIMHIGYHLKILKFIAPHSRYAARPAFLALLLNRMVDWT